MVWSFLEVVVIFIHASFMLASEIISIKDIILLAVVN